MIRAIRASIREAFQFTPLEKSALRTAIAMVIAVLIAFYLHLDQVQWVLIALASAMSPYEGSTFERSTIRVIMTVVGSVIGVILAIITVNNTVLFLLAVFFSMTFFSYASYFNRYKYAFWMGGVTTLLILTSVVDNPQNPFYYSIWRTAEMVLGMCVAVFATYFIFPVRTQAIFKDETIKYARAIGDYFEAVSDLYFINSNSLEKSSFHRNAVREQLTKCINIINEYKKELVKNEAENTIVDNIMATQRTIVMKIITLQHHYNPAVNHQLFKTDTLRLRELHNDFVIVFKEISSTADTLLQMQRQLEALEKQFNSIRDQFNVMQQSRQLQQYSLDETLLLHLYFDSLEQILMTLKELVYWYQKFYRIQVVATQPPKDQRLFQFKYDEKALKRSIKLGLSGVLAVTVWFWTNWTDGFQGIVSSFIIGFSGDVYEWQARGWLRLLGCVMGAFVGFAALFLLRSQLWDLLLVLFIFGGIFAYLTHSGSKYSYAGLQANMALAMSLIVYDYPTTSVDQALGRVSGIILGIVATTVVSYLLWPPKPRQDFIESLQQLEKKVLEKLSSNLRVAHEKKHVPVHLSLANQFDTVTNLLLQMKQWKYLKPFELECAQQQLEDLRNLFSIGYDLKFAYDFQQAIDFGKIYDANLQAVIEKISVQVRKLNESVSEDSQTIVSELKIMDTNLQVMSQRIHQSPYQARLKPVLVSKYVAIVMSLKNAVKTLIHYLELQRLV